MSTTHEVYLSLGSNTGDRKRNMQLAVALLHAHVGRVVRQSSLIETEPWGFTSPNLFLNGCVLLRTEKTPQEVLEATQAIERKLGRTQKSTDGQYHDRPIDIDILLYDDLQLNEPQLTLPHPHMTERDFVMIPLREIMPDK